MKKQSLITVLLTVLLSMMGEKTFAYDIAVPNAEGIYIYYNYINDGKDLEVAHGVYLVRELIIPDEVTYMDRTRKVIAIGEGAFEDVTGLSSITIPNSVVSIGNYAFSRTALTSAIIPNEVTSIGFGIFLDCKNLTSVTIGNNVTSIEYDTFYGCESLTSVSIGSNVTSIEPEAFYGCNKLSTIIIPNSVTTISDNAFSGCSNLSSVVIGTNVSSIGGHAFYGCNSLTTLNIPNSVTYIGDYAFYNCNSLTSISIPSNVTSIDEGAFSGWDLPTVISKIENPFQITGKESNYGVFSQNTFNNATLYVPVGTIDKYKTTEGWKDFLFIEEGDGPNGGGGDPGLQKCSKPTIGYLHGELTFNCETDGATCHYSITDDDIKAGNGNKVELGVTYQISVYATKDGYENSETVTATLCWIDVEPKTEGITNGVANVRANAVLIQSNGGSLSISGVDEGMPINVYDTAGRLVGSAKTSLENTTINTSLRSGNIGIVKIGDKAVKVIIR